MGGFINDPEFEFVASAEVDVVESPKDDCATGREFNSVIFVIYALDDRAEEALGGAEWFGEEFVGWGGPRNRVSVEGGMDGDIEPEDSFAPSTPAGQNVEP